MGEDSMVKVSRKDPEIADSVKRLARGVIDSLQLTDVTFGVVEAVSPLKVRIGQGMLLTDEYLILTNAVKDHTVKISIEWESEPEKDHTHGNGNNGTPTTGVEDPKEGHKHEVKGRKLMTIHNSLTVGEKVLLLRTLGGQSYVVIDRVDEIPNLGEWK
jgi:hypothetical protein